MQDRILVIGSGGQIGTELVEELRKKYGNDNVVASDLREVSPEMNLHGPYEKLNVLDKERLIEIVKKYQISQVYLLAALLSATAEKSPELGWDLNMNSLLNVLDLAKMGRIKRVYWPSSIAVFGPNTPKLNTPQFTVMEPDTVYGISKLAGERWCEYYFKKFGVDVRSLRYPGLIGWKSAPGGGTTDYAVHIFHEALKKESYECFLTENTMLPMMFMSDAIKATLGIMEAEASKVKIRSSYNIAGFSFTPAELASKIKNQIPNFSISYKSDFRQNIANSWPGSINDLEAKNDWSWNPDYNLDRMVNEMISNLKPLYKK